MRGFMPFYFLMIVMVLPLFSDAQLIVVTGNIINERTGSAIENVSIFESFSGIGTITNVSGFFSLMLKPGNTEFVITHAGFKDLSKKMILQSDTTLTISLKPQISPKSKFKDTEHQKAAEKIEKKN